MASILVPLALIVGGFGIGYYLYANFSQTGAFIANLRMLVSAGIWLVLALTLILWGTQAAMIVGFIALVISTWTAASSFEQTQEQAGRASLLPSSD